MVSKSISRTAIRTSAIPRRPNCLAKLSDSYHTPTIYNLHQLEVKIPWKLPSFLIVNFVSEKV